MNLDGMGVPLSCDTGMGLMRKVLDLTTLKNRSIDAYLGIFIILTSTNHTILTLSKIAFSIWDTIELTRIFH